MASYKNAGEQVKQLWASRDGRQRTFLLGGAAATALMLIFFVKFIGTPDYKTLYTGLEPEDAQSLSAKLDAAGIPHQTSADGKAISVPADKLDAARMQSAADGGPHSGRMGFELFDKMSWGQTEFDEKVTYQRALEGELERSIATLADVQSARVHLVMPTDSVFLDREREAKASVVLRLRRGMLPKEAALAISRLVAGAVDNLKPEDVSIVDADTDRSLNVSTSAADGSGADADLSARLINTLEPIVGTGKIRASVNVDYDQGSTDENQEKYDPTVSAVLSDQKSEDVSGGSAVPAGVPGTSSNIPKTKPQPPANPPLTQSSKTETAQYGVNKTMIHTITPAGRIQRITAAVVVDDEIVKTVQKGKTIFTRKKRSTEELNQIKRLAEAAIGFDEKRGDSISVEDLPFDADSAQLDMPAVGWTSQVQKTVTDFSPLLRPLSLLVLFILAYMFVIRPVQKHVFAATPAPIGVEPQLQTTRMEALPDTTNEPRLEVSRATQLREQTAEMIRQKPLHTARAVQAWLHEEPS
ncbi:MAG TPA: flagellar basal-body MS-ring/collar protein FliF [Terracidiphilus sp.]|nr:flagellar basal-body MS-ring/collar protein FliF [Terracidiphilus sp.]